MLAPFGVLGGHDALDRAHPVIEPARDVVKLVEELLVGAGEDLRLPHLVT